jgi:hypothetical protein
MLKVPAWAGIIYTQNYFLKKAGKINYDGKIA